MKCLRLFVLLGALAVPVSAEDGGEAPDQGVARISVLNGDVTVRRGDSGEFVAAELNAPLVSLDHLLTDEKSRAEIQLDWANFVRVAPESEVRLAELKDRDFLIQVSSGTVTFRVLEDFESRLEISTPDLAIRPRRHGVYRVTVWDDSTEVTVRAGEAEIFTGGKTDVLRSGLTLVVSGDPADPQVSYQSAISWDEWDRWNEARDRDLENRGSYTYVSRDIYGVEDLAGYGQWVYDAPYGWVWVPRVSATWAPYRVGRWTWVNYYGWTWLSGDPWGWAPYHYGRWYYASRHGWVWYPGEIRTRYYWRPALVTFFGWGSNVGWVPLAPYEVYRPWYGPSRTSVVNYTTVTNINVAGNFKNARFISGRSGVTSVGSTDFGRKKITINNYIVAKDRDLKHVSNADRWLPQQPSRENRQFSDRRVPERGNARRNADQNFVSTRPGTGRQDTPRRTETPAVNNVANAPRNDSDRGRGSEQNRGRAQNPTPVANRPDNSRRPETPAGNSVVSFPRNDSDRGRGSEGNRGRAQNPTPVANRPDNSRRPETAAGNSRVSFPRNDNDRVRGSEGNRGRAQNPTPDANRPDNSRRLETPAGNNRVSFPRNDNDRVRAENPTPVANRPGNSRGPEIPAGNSVATFPRNDSARGRNGSVNSGNSDIRVPSEPDRRAEISQPRERVAVPRAEPERPRPSEDRGRPAGPPRRESEPSRPAVSEVRRPQASPRPEPQRPAEPQGRSDRSAGVERERPQAPPQASSAPSSSSGNDESNNYGGRGRGRR
jgi:hypothetical protein